MRCSGTNFLAALIEENTTLKLTADLGWKHGFPTAATIPSDMLVVVAVRDPIDWIRSLYRKPWHFREQDAGMPFAQFIRSPVDTVVDPDFWTDELERSASLLPGALNWLAMLRLRWESYLHRAPGAGTEGPFIAPPETVEGRPLQFDRHPLTGLPFANPVAMRAAKLTALLSYAKRECCCAVVRYEDARDRPQAFLQHLRERCGMEVAQRYTPITRWLGDHGEDTGRVAPDRIAPADARFLAEHLDLSLERGLGYEESVEALALAGASDDTREESRNDVGSARNSGRRFR